MDQQTLALEPEKPQIVRDEDQDGWRIYRVNGKPHLSVTLILSCVVHERLKKWFINNSKNAVNKKSSETAKIGSDIHKMVEDSAIDPSAPVPDALKGHAEQWERIRDEYQIRPIQSEFMVHHPHGFAGQVDLYADSKFGKTIFDVKTGRTTVQAGWQMAAYRLAALSMGMPVDAMAVISIPRDGSKAKVFKYEHIDFCTQRFLSTFECFKGLYWSKLDKMGFEQWKEFSPEGYQWRDE